MPPDSENKRHFFLSHSSKDIAWAEWIAWQLEANGYTFHYDAWDLLPGRSFVEWMNGGLAKSEFLLALFSPNYFKGPYTTAEWHAVFASDPLGNKGLIIPIGIVDLDNEEVPPLLRQRVRFPLHELDEPDAQATLLREIRKVFDGTGKPSAPPSFPGLKSSTAAPSFPRLPQFRRCPLRNDGFIGRDDNLTEIRNRLRSGSHRTALTQALKGPGGIGKSAIALEYAYRFQADYDMVWWLQAGRTHDGETEGGGALQDAPPPLLGSEFGALAVETGLMAPDAKEPEKIAAARRWLEEHDRWLLIFDNAEWEEDLEPYLPRDGKGHVLVTSRYDRFEQTCHPLKVEVMKPEEAEKLLLDRSGLTDTAGAAAMAKELGYLPLALNLAGWYIRKRNHNFWKYLELYRTRFKEVVAWKLSKGKALVDYSETVLTTWDISFQQAEQDCPDAIAILNVCAFFAPDDIPFSLIRGGVGGLSGPLAEAVKDGIRWGDILETLKTYYLIEKLGADGFSLHRVLQKVLQERLSAKEEELFSVMSLVAVNQALPDPSDVSRWQEFRRLVPHGETVAERFQGTDQAALIAARIWNQISIFYFHHCIYSNGISAAKKAFEINEIAFGPEHHYTAGSLNNLASLYQLLGQFGEAEHLFLRTLAIRENLFGLNHPETANSLNNLGTLYLALGKYEEAETYFQRSLAIREKIMAPDDPSKAVTLDSLAVLFEKQNRYQEALDFSTRSIDIFLKNYGINHNDTIKAILNFGVLYLSLGSFKEAAEIFTKIIPIQKKLFGSHHPELAQSLSNLAQANKFLGHNKLAEKNLKDALMIYNKNEKYEFIRISHICNELGELLREQGSYEIAEDYHRKALVLRERHPECTNLSLATSFNNLGLTLLNLGHQYKAEPLLLRSLEIKRKETKIDSFEIQLTLINLSFLYLSLERLEEAILYLEEAIENLNQKKRTHHHRPLLERLLSLAKLGNIKEIEKIIGPIVPNSNQLPP